VAASLPLDIDPGDLVGRAYALLEQEAQAWRQRQRADLLPVGER